MVLIVVVLVSILAASLTGFVDEGEDAMELHATGTFDFDVKPDDKIHLRPETLKLNDATLQLQINGYPVQEWKGQSPVELTCLYPGDTITVVSIQDDTTAIVDRETLRESTKCTRISSLPKKFKYAYVDYKSSSEMERIADGFPFTLAINPDGPGSDGKFGHSVFKQSIATVPFTNPWHYYKRYEQGIGPFDEGPVWLIIMVDNVHWKNNKGIPGAATYNWTDAPPSGVDPGSKSYEVINGKVQPINRNIDDKSGTILGKQRSKLAAKTEPTNDVYMLFKPRCKSEADHGTLALFAVTAGYANDIYFNGKKVVDDTSKWKSSAADVDNEPERTFEVEPRNC